MPDASNQLGVTESCLLNPVFIAGPHDDITVNARDEEDRVTSYCGCGENSTSHLIQDSIFARFSEKAGQNFGLYSL